MRSIQTQQTFSLSSVKPLEGLFGYRQCCLEATREAVRGGTQRLEHSPITGARLQPYGEVEGLAYVRDPENGSLFLAARPEPAVWGRLLAQVSRYRHSPEAFHVGLTQSRTDHVYAPKLEWIEDALRFQEVHRPDVLEVITAPSDFTTLLKESGSFAEVVTVDETQLAQGQVSDPSTRRTTASGRGPSLRVVPSEQRESRDDGRPVGAALLLESLDRAHDSVALLHAVAGRLEAGGLLFVTSLVSSGFDMEVLGLRNLYIYPPDRANCFSLRGLETLLRRAGFTLVEVSTPGVLDVEIVRAHVQHDPSIVLSSFERRLLETDAHTHEAFQTFLQQQGLSSFARIVARKD